jgi:hypothetical protein
MQKQAGAADRGLSNVMLTLLSIVTLIIALDYAHIIYLHFKMVGFLSDGL